MYIKGFKEFLGKNPGWLRKISGAYFSYYKPSFHPWQRNTTRQMQHWKNIYQID
jgi:hypothetical protein